MVAKQRIRMANEKHSKNITQRGNVAKTSVGAPSQPCRAACSLSFPAALGGPVPPGGESSSRRGVAVQSPVCLKAAQPPREAPSRSASLCFGDLPPSLRPSPAW